MIRIRRKRICRRREREARKGFLLCMVLLIY
nr:MAG TPA: hypothetical protein [Caudoviricetes sp.]